jgi:hypothetical protein
MVRVIAGGAGLTAGVSAGTGVSVFEASEMKRDETVR